MRGIGLLVVFAGSLAGADTSTPSPEPGASWIDRCARRLERRRHDLPPADREVSHLLMQRHLLYLSVLNSDQFLLVVSESGVAPAVPDGWRVEARVQMRHLGSRGAHMQGMGATTERWHEYVAMFRPLVDVCLQD